MAAWKILVLLYTKVYRLDQTWGRQWPNPQTNISLIIVVTSTRPNLKSRGPVLNSRVAVAQANI
jgi:hypothetical protein